MSEEKDLFDMLFSKEEDVEEKQEDDEEYISEEEYEKLKHNKEGYKDLSIKDYPLSDFPSPVRNNIVRYLFGMATLIVLGIIVFIEFGFNIHLFIALSVVTVILGVCALASYMAGKEEKVVTFSGIVDNCTEHGVKGINKKFVITLYNVEADKYLSFDYSKEIPLSTAVTLYLNADTEVVMSDDGPAVESYLALRKSNLSKEDNDDIEEGKVNVEDYVSGN